MVEDAQKIIKDLRYSSAHVSGNDGDWKKCRERTPESDRDNVNYRYSREERR